MQLFLFISGSVLEYFKVQLFLYISGSVFEYFKVQLFLYISGSGLENFTVQLFLYISGSGLEYFKVQLFLYISGSGLEYLQWFSGFLIIGTVVSFESCLVITGIGGCLIFLGFLFIASKYVRKLKGNSPPPFKSSLIC